WSEAAVKLAFNHFEVWIGRPDKVVDILGMKGDGLAAVAIVGVAGRHAGCADYVALRQSDIHIIGAEVGKEFGRGVELVAVPCAMPPHSNLGKPLSGKQECALVSGASDNFRKRGAKLDPELHVLARRYRMRQAHFEYRLVIGIAVVGRDELHLLRQVAHTNDLEGSDFVRAEILRVPRLEFARAEVAITVCLTHPGRLRLERVQVEMKREAIER